MGVHGAGLHFIADEPGCGCDTTRHSVAAYDLNGRLSENIPLEFAKSGFVLRLPDCAENHHLIARQAVLGGGKYYCRIAPRREMGRQWPPEVLDSIAKALPVVTGSSADSHSRRIPAAYTYFGQFLAHELSNLTVWTDQSSQMRTSALDLDSLWAFDAGFQPFIDPENHYWHRGIGVGRVAGGPGVGAFLDLPRDKSGKAQIPDERNDSNLGVAQIHVMLSRFYHVVSHQNAGGDTESVKRSVRRSVHAVVLHDYLKRLIEPDVYRDVLRNGRSLIYPGGLREPHRFLVPIEFVTAFFRIGHSMVRPAYPGWLQSSKASPATLKDLFKHAYGGGSLIHGRLSADWPVVWPRLLCDDPAPVFALATDPAMTEQLKSLAQSHFASDILEELAPYPTKPIDLATVTLRRGRGVELPSAQELCRSAPLPPNVSRSDVLPILSEMALAETLDKVLAPSGSGAFSMQDLCRQTPLWLYTLLESAASSDGERLGPLASRVVMETLHAAIEAGSDGGLPEEPTTLTDVLLLSQQWEQYTLSN